MTTRNTTFEGLTGQTHPSLGPSQGSTSGGVFATIELWRARYRQRRVLLRLDAHMMADLDLDAEDILKEAEKPFWLT